jgi:hypothetical protein
MHPNSRRLTGNADLRSPADAEHRADAVLQGIGTDAAPANIRDERT